MNIVEFSKKAKVSTATVSRAFHEPEKLRPDTRERILTLAEKFGYYPNASGRALVRGRHDVLGLIWPLEVEGAEAYFAQRVLASLTQELIKRDLDLLICPIDRHHRATFLHARRTLQRSRCDAWILLYPRPDDILLDALNACGKPVVSYMSEIPDAPTWKCVQLDQDDWMKDCLQRLRASGSRQVLFFGGRPTEPDHNQRLLSFLKLAPKFFGKNAHSLFGDEGNEKSFRAIFSACAIDAIIGADDHAALTAIDLCRKIKRSVPRDVRIVGIDDLPQGTVSRPPLSTYRQPLEAMTRCAVELALGLRQRPGKFNALFIPRCTLG